MARCALLTCQRRVIEFTVSVRSEHPTISAMRIEVTDELVCRIARLARLELSPDQQAGLKEHFAKVLAYVETLGELDVEGGDVSHIAAASTADVRVDEARPSLPVDAATGGAPVAHEGCFVVPQIVDAAEGGA